MKNKVLFAIVGCLTFIYCMRVGVAQEVPPLPDICEGFLCSILGKFPEISGWVIALFTMIGLILRAVAEFLGFLATQLKSAGASSWAVKLGSFSEWCAQIIGWFGGGTPSIVLDKKVAKKLGQTVK